MLKCITKQEGLIAVPFIEIESGKYEVGEIQTISNLPSMLNTDKNGIVICFESYQQYIKFEKKLTPLFDTYDPSPEEESYPNTLYLNADLYAKSTVGRVYYSNALDKFYLTARLVLDDTLLPEIEDVVNKRIVESNPRAAQLFKSHDELKKEIEAFYEDILKKNSEIKYEAPEWATTD